MSFGQFWQVSCEHLAHRKVLSGASIFASLDANVRAQAFERLMCLKNASCVKISKLFEGV